jgi:hypothetical protein
MHPTTLWPADSRGASWLFRHGLPADVVPTALVTKRVQARWRVRFGSVLATVVLIMAVLPIAIHAHRVMRAMPYLALVIVLALHGVELWMMRRVERRLAATLPRRAARPMAQPWWAILGRRLLAMIAVEAGCVLGISALALAFGGPETRAAAIAILLGSAVFAALATGEVAHAVRRPARAEDEPSLAVDELLRRVAAHRVVSNPIPMMLCVVLISTVTLETEWLLMAWGACGWSAW